jgi:hypothetical protein
MEFAEENSWTSETGRNKELEKMHNGNEERRRNKELKRKA